MSAKDLTKAVLDQLDWAALGEIYFHEDGENELRQRRKAMTEGIPDDLLREYEGLFKTRSGIGVCAVEKHYCQGCYNKITMNDTARLLGKSSVVRCGSCQRILYMGSQ